MITAKQRRQYLRNQIESASREQLILMLYDGLLRFCEQGKAAIQEKEFVPAHEALMRAQAVLMELVNALDQDNGGEIAENLGRLYAYMFQKLVEANMTHTIEPIDETLKHASQIRDAWSKAMQNEPQRPATPPAVADSQDKVQVSTTDPSTPQDNPTTNTQSPAVTPPKPGQTRPMQSRLSVQG